MHPLDGTDPVKVGRYRLVGRLGQGGMGRVYLARSPGGRPAAVKVINDHLQQDEHALHRFRREAETLGTVRSAYTAALIDAELETPPYWLATEYVPGPTLHAAVQVGGPFPADLSRILLAALAEGLADVHVHGVWHRDVKPHNVILSATGPQLIDFGIARSISSLNLTQAGSWVGSPGYMAPESIAESVTGPAADVFALGATLAFAVTGRPPFGTGPAASVSYRVVHGEADLSGVDRGIAELISACMHRDPERRPDPQRIVEMCESQTDLVHHPAYQRALAAGTLGGPGHTVADGEPETRPFNPTLVAPPAYGEQAGVTGFPDDPSPDAAVPFPASRPDAGSSRRRLSPLVLTSVAVVAVAGAAAGVLLQAAGTEGQAAARDTPPSGAGSSVSAAETPGGGATKDRESASPAAEETDEETDLPTTLTVNARRVFAAGDSLRSARAELVMQPDGNLVVYDEKHEARWAANVFGEGNSAVFQEDGNLVIYDADSEPVWSSGSEGHQGAVLVLLADGNVVIKQGGDVVWQSGTAH
ncbi:protein kinase [Streptomyces tendae]|uniref:protein kinase domain-containing protein n=1 Tax=Streptomyces tendae TaxID=1932 RepID=UPI00379FF2AE